MIKRLIALITCCSNLAALGFQITCPPTASVLITQGWAITAQHSSVDWDGALAHDQQPLGALKTMDVSFAAWLNGYVVRCSYANGQLTTVAPIQAKTNSQGVLQNCEKSTCSVSFQ